jgi:glycosyltransferase involved in cell wall biosynthesis
MPIEISYILSIYNKQDYIQQTIRNILTQEDSGVTREFIFVDDFSSDNSVQMVIDIFQGTKMEWKIIKNDRNLGPAVSLNKAFSCSRGKFIALIDADDLIAPNTEKICYTAITDNNCDWVFVKSKSFLGNVSLLNANDVKLKIIDNLHKRTILEYVLKNTRIAMTYSLIERNLFKKANGFDERIFVQDVSIFLRLAKHSKKLAYIKTNLYFPRRGQLGSESGNLSRQHHDGFYAFKYFIEDYSSSLNKIEIRLLLKKCLSVVWKKKRIEKYKYLSPIFYYYIIGFVTRKLLYKWTKEF